jgi:hypothetical protein
VSTQLADPVLDGLFRELLDLIAGECGVRRAARPPLHHVSGTDLYPVIGVLADAMSPVRGRCRAGMGVRCRRTRNITRAGYCPRCHRRWLRQCRMGRLEEYAELTREVGLPRVDAAKRVGVCERTAWRYEADLRAGQEAAGMERRAA